MIDLIGGDFVGLAKPSAELPGEQWSFSQEQIILQLNTCTVARIYSMYPRLLTGGVKGGDAWDIAEAYTYLFYADNDFLEIVNFYGQTAFSVVDIHIDIKDSDHFQAASFFLAETRLGEESDYSSILDMIFYTIGIGIELDLFFAAEIVQKHCLHDTFSAS